MSSPPIDPLPPDLQALLRSERQRDPVLPEASARIQSQLAASIGVFGPAAVAPSAPPPALIPALSGKVLGIVATAFVIGTLTGAGVTWAVLQRQEPVVATPVSTTASTSASTSAPSLEPAASAPSTTAEPTAAGTPTTPAVTALGAAEVELAAPVDAGTHADAAARNSESNADRDLAAERNLMEQARSSLAHSRWDAALSALDRHQRRFPRGTLAEERDSMRVPTLVMLGRHGDARTAASRFHARYPQSIFNAGVDQALRSIP